MLPSVSHLLAENIRTFDAETPRVRRPTGHRFQLLIERSADPVQDIDLIALGLEPDDVFPSDKLPVEMRPRPKTLARARQLRQDALG
jgi:hypothetical protein